MTSDEVLTALRCCASDNCNGCPSHNRDLIGTSCIGRTMREAADLIEFQQQGLEALTKIDEGLKKRGGTLKEFLRRGDEVVQGHRDPAGPPGDPGFAGDIFICPTCNSPRVFYNAEKDAYICPSCGWQDKEE